MTEPCFAVVQTVSSAFHAAQLLTDNRIQPEAVCGLLWVSRETHYGQGWVECTQCKAALTYTVGTKVRYDSMRGRVLAKIVKGAYYLPGHGWYVDARITSRKHSIYRCGQIVHFPVGTPWLALRSNAR